MDEPTLIPNPELDASETYDAGMALLAQADALLEVHAIGCDGSLNLHDHPANTAGEYISAIETLVAAGIECLHASTDKRSGRITRSKYSEESKGSQEKRVALARDLFTRINNISYYFHPDEELKETRTRKQATNALIGIYDLFEDLQDELGIEGPLFGEVGRP